MLYVIGDRKSYFYNILEESPELLKKISTVIESFVQEGYHFKTVSKFFSCIFISLVDIFVTK